MLREVIRKKPKVGRLITDERGVSMTDVMVAGILTALVVAAFYTIFYAFSSNVSIEEQRIRAQREIRPVMSNLVVEMRQGQDLEGDGNVMVALDSAWTTAGVTFFADRRAEFDGPERYRYYLTGCVGVRCDLMQELLPADAASGPSWTYTGVPIARRMLSQVLTDGPDPMFAGVSWAGGVETITNFCGLGIPCDFEVVRIRLRVDPDPESDRLPAVQVQEDVRLRNG